MQDILNQRSKLYELIQKIKTKNPPEKTSKAMKIIKTLLTNIRNNPEELKFRILKTTNPNIASSVMNIIGIGDLLSFLGYVAKYDGNFVLEATDLNNVELCLNILNTDINQFNESEYVIETSKEMRQNPQVAKEMEIKRKKLEDERKQKERINQMIEADKIERKNKFTYK